MADYITQTVIHQNIPECLLAPFERLLLAETSKATIGTA